jgi:hypothetical protein
MQPFLAEPMRMWPISTRVNKHENDEASIVEPIELATDAAWSVTPWCWPDQSRAVPEKLAGGLVVLGYSLQQYFVR